MKKLLIFVLALVMLSCQEKQQSSNNTRTYSQESEVNDAGLDLSALNEIVRTSSSPEEIEQKVNSENGINNVDLDNDGNVDYIRVVGYDNPKGYEFRAVESTSGEESTLCQMDFDQSSNVVRTTGNPNYYSTNNYYESRFSPTDWLICAWLFSRPIYVSPYHYGYYGHYYRPYHSVSYHAYHSRPTVVSYRKTSTKYVTSTKRVSTPSKTFTTSKTAKQQQLSSKSSFSKGFSQRDKSKPINSKGFQSKPTTSTSTVKPSSSSSSSSSYKPASSSTKPSSSSSSSSSYKPTTSKKSNSWFGGSSSSKKSSGFSGSSSSRKSSGFSSSRSSSRSSSSSRRR